ncbi:GNAT superfamily N-acetyltransferase [Crossiella equi]|uniref:GNAT superfamily N-acetyltransferase n=1 Tax=Crossiella equi TaxID=130796 RepID=A0ABS5AQ55_9PSEU|nr:GNAT family N-acetyltransferase [Crossiella equi]MBP2478703.1 GNAT superfamily N-acetyltransferase [Crossiella equi]
MHTELSTLLAEAAAGRPPAADGGLTILPQGKERLPAVLGFTAHHVIVADVDPDWVRAQLPEGDLGAPMNPPFLAALCEATGGREVHFPDAVLAAPPLAGPPELTLRPADSSTHDRVRRAESFRTEVQIWTCEGGLLLLGRGVGDRLEVAAEVDPAARGRGLGRALFTAARALAEEPVWAQVAPGNVASFRAVLAAGFTPVCAEALLVNGAG